MEIRVLQYFLTVVQEENITRAAETLHITQPTLSRQLTQLEEELGARLLLRGKRKISLTDAGLLLYRRALELVELARKAEEEVAGNSRELEGAITIGSGEVLAAQILPRIFQSLHPLYPKVRYELISGNADQMKERLDMGLMDLAILMEPVDLGKYDFLRLPYMDTWGVLMPVDSPLAAQESVTLEELRGLPMGVSARSSVQKSLSSRFGKLYDELNFVVTYNLIGNAAIMVEQGLIYALTLKGAVELYDSHRLCFRPLSPRVINGAVLAWKKKLAMSPALTVFLAHAREILEKDGGAHAL